MKKFLSLLLLLVLLFIPMQVFATGSSFALSSVEYYSTADKLDRIQIKLVAVADNGTAAFPTYSLDPTAYTNIHSTNGFKGWYLYKVVTDPGTTGPTNGAWDLDITDALGFLQSANLLDDRSSTATQEVKFVSGYPNIDNTWTLSIGDNAVNSASVTIYLLFVAN